jgi:hypothetical protein
MVDNLTDQNKHVTSQLLWIYINLKTKSLKIIDVDENLGYM